ncbi:hypothetical protein J3Q64DRAFT_1699379 [Phycomyces blakesleeanus]|uniref:Uncharacterized protein n=1 Tax=Phycomyces blakesleeanus TaxID=4837 RepID=A0ABR3AXG1_PHYBL
MTDCHPRVTRDHDWNTPNCPPIHPNNTKMFWLRRQKWRTILVGFGQGTGSQTSVSVPLGGSLVAAGSTDRIPAGITSEISRENKAKVFKLIRGYMRKDKFTSTEPVLVSANEGNPR